MVRSKAFLLLVYVNIIFGLLCFLSGMSAATISLLVVSYTGCDHVTSVVSLVIGTGCSSFTQAGYPTNYLDIAPVFAGWYSPSFWCPYISYMINSLRPSDTYMVGNLTIIGSDNGLSPGRRQAIIWTNVGILLIGPLGINFSEILIEITTFSFKKMRLKVSSAKRRPFCLGLNVLNMDIAVDSGCTAIHSRLTWPVGTPTVFQKPLTVLAQPCNLPAVRALRREWNNCHGTVEFLRMITKILLF